MQHAILREKGEKYRWKHEQCSCFEFKLSIATRPKTYTKIFKHRFVKPATWEGERVIDIKEMTFEKKYSTVLSGMKTVESFVLPFVKENLGEESVNELKTIWEKQNAPVPEDASYEQKYDIAFRNWILNYDSAFELVEKSLGQGGVERLIQADIEENKKNSSGLAFSLLKFIKAISPGIAFKMFAKQMAYQFQVYAPLTVSELNGKRMVVETAHCKVLDIHGEGALCTIGCQKAGPMWMRAEFRVEMAVERRGEACTSILSPIK